jgi:hypothetical protein
MSEAPTTLESVLERRLRRIVREEIKAAAGNGNTELLEPEELAARF